MHDQLDIHGNASQAPVSAPQTPRQPQEHLFHHARQIKGQASFLDQRSLVIASLLTRPANEHTTREDAR